MPAVRALSRSELELAAVESRILREFPDFKMIPKDKSWLMKVVGVFLKIITFGCMISFMSRFATTIGNTVYTGRNWVDMPPIQKATILRHEQVHMRQRKRMGTVRYALYYLFWPLPIIFAAGRRNLEMEAYTESLLAYEEYYGVEALKQPEFRNKVIGNFTSPSYFWMWPFRSRIERWYDGVVHRLEVTAIHGKAR